MRLRPPGRHFSAPRLELAVKRLLFFVPHTSLNLLGGRKVLFLISHGPSIKVGAAQTSSAKEEEKIRPRPQNRRLLACGTFSLRWGDAVAVNQASAMDYFAAFVSKV
jgi:hypothetical protein